MNSSGPPDDVEEEFPEESIGTIVEQVDTPEGTTFNAEIVQVFCPACGEQSNYTFSLSNLPIQRLKINTVEEY